MPQSEPPPADGARERVVVLRPRTALVAWGSLLALAAAILLVWSARHVLTWILIALFLALAIDPVVHWLQTRGVQRRGAAAGVVYVAFLLIIAGFVVLFVPPLVAQVNDLVQAIPRYAQDLTHGRGPLGFLETRYHVVERARDIAAGGGGGVVSGGANALVSITRGVVTGVAATVTIAFLTFFMLVEGPAWTERAYGLMSPESERRWRAVGLEIRRVIGGYVTGNLLLSLIAATTASIVLLALQVPFPLALGLVVFVLDLIPLAGATIAAVILTAVAFSTSTTAAIVVLAYFIVYQQIENHLLQPLVYGRAVQLSPLATLIAILLGAELAGVVGALAAIPVAGSLRVLVQDWTRHRRIERESALTSGAVPDGAPAPARPGGPPLG